MSEDEKYTYKKVKSEVRNKKRQERNVSIIKYLFDNNL